MKVKLFDGPHEEVEEYVNKFLTTIDSGNIQSITHRVSSKYSEYVSVMIVYLT